MIKRPTQSGWAYALVAGLFAIGIVAYALRAIGYFSSVPGDLGDARFNSVILEHLLQWTTGKAELWNPKFYYPFKGVLAFSDNHLGSGLVYILLRLLGVAREQSFDGWFLVGIILNFAATFVALRKLGIAVAAAGIGAFLFTFALPGLAQEGHAQLIYRMGIPLAWVAVWEALQQRRVLPLGRVVVWTTLQIFFSIYLGFFLIYLLLATILAAAALGQWRVVPDVLASWRKETMRARAVFAGAVIVCVALLVWLFRHYEWVTVLYGFKRNWAEIATMLPRLQSYLIADHAPLDRWLGAWVKNLPARNEHQMFFGIGFWVVAVIGLASTRRPESPYFALARTAALALLILAAMTLIVGGWSIYVAFAALPGFGAIRAVARIGIVMAFPLAILASLGSSRLMDFAKQSGRPMLAVASAILVVGVSLEVVFYSPVTTPVAAWQQRLSDLRSQLPSVVPADAILFVARDESQWSFTTTELDSMVLAQDLGIATANGYSGNQPPGNLTPQPCMSGANILLGYDGFANLDKAAIAALNARVIDVKLTPCDQPPAIPFYGHVDPSQLPLLALNIDSLKRDGAVVTAAVSLTNHSARRFDTLSATSQPVQLAWRLVPVSPTGEPLATADFERRRDLLWSIPPEGVATTTIRVVLPEGGTYRIDFSMVQDQVAWLNDIGLKMAVALVPTK